MTRPKIRLATPEDAAAIAAIYAPVVRDSVISFEADPPDAAAMARRMATIAATYPWLVAERSEVVGYAYASQHNERAAYRWSVNVSAYVAAGARGQGIGRALYTALFEVLRLQGFHRAYAGITLPNAASVGLHEAMGMTPVGVYRRVGWKFGAWHDVGWWQADLVAPQAPQNDPVSVADVTQHPGVAAAPTA